MELAAEITENEWMELEQFAEKRLRRTGRNPASQHTLTQWCGRSLVHSALESFGLGEKSKSAGRRLRASQRTARGLIFALQSAINSIIANSCRCAEAGFEHLSLNVETPALNPPAGTDVVAEISERELRSQLFEQLQHGAETEMEDAALTSLHDDCITGNARGGGGVDREVKRQIRRQAREVLGPMLDS